MSHGPKTLIFSRVLLASETQQSALYFWKVAHARVYSLTHSEDKRGLTKTARAIPHARQADLSEEVCTPRSLLWMDEIHFAPL